MHIHIVDSWKTHYFIDDSLLPRSGLLRMFMQERSAVSILYLVYFADALEMLDGLLLALLVLLWFGTHSFVESLPWREVCAWWTANDQVRLGIYS